MKFIKRALVVDAIQWNGVNLPEIKNFMGVETLPYRVEIDGILIRTLDGNMEAIKGDWIIKGIKGEFYPCKPDIFETTYEPVTEAQ